MSSFVNIPNTSIRALCVFLCALCGEAAAGIECVEPSRVFVGEEVPRFTCNGSQGEFAPPFQWSVLDWRGNVLCHDISAPDGGIEIPGLPPGYWTLQVDGANAITFTVVPDPASRPPVADSPFAADSAFSWMDIPYAFAPSFKADYSSHLARLIRAAGISQTRERCAWDGVQKEIDGPVKWGKYLRNAQLLAENGIKVSWMNANSPKWAGGKGGGWGTQSLATNLVAVRDFCEEAGRAFAPCASNFEYLNEPDLMFPAWDAAAQFKAASVGFRAGAPGIPVANFAMCLGVDFTYDNLVFDNGMADYIDIFNIHNYGKIAEYDAFDARIRRFLEKRGIGGMPVIVTESGCEEEGEATLSTDTPRCKAQTPEQEMFVADFLAKAQIKRQYGGIWRNHFFIFASFHERGGRKDWGLVRRDGSARPGVAAVAALTAALDGARMIGRADVGTGIEAYLYVKDDGTKTLAFWRSGADEAALRLGENPGALSLVDWCGTPRPLVRGQPISVEGRVSYLSGDFDIPVAKPAAPEGTLRVRHAEDFSDIDLSTIVRVDFPEDEFDEVDGFTAVETKRGGEGRVSIDIWNLDPWPKRGRLVSENGELGGWPEGEIVLPPRGVFSHEAMLRPRCGRDGEARWRLQGVFDGRCTTPFVAPVRDFASALAGMRRYAVDAADPAIWRKNTSASKVTFTPEDGCVMRIDLSWGGAAPTPDGRWAYNGIRVPESARRGLRYVCFEIRSEQDKVENNYRTANVFARLSGGRDVRIPCAAPAKEWTRIHVAIPCGDPGETVEWIGVGGNPAGKQVVMRVRNVEFYCTKSQE